MTKKSVNFIATKYKDQATEVHFYTNQGEKVSLDTVKRAPTEEKVEFYIETAK